MTFDETLLNAIRNDLARIRADCLPIYGVSQREKGTAPYRHSRLADDGIIKIDLTLWLGHEPTSTERQRCHRALSRLEAAGAIRRVSSGERANFIEVVEAVTSGV